LTCEYSGILGSDEVYSDEACVLSVPFWYSALEWRPRLRPKQQMRSLKFAQDSTVLLDHIQNPDVMPVDGKQVVKARRQTTKSYRNARQFDFSSAVIFKTRVNVQ